MDWSHLIKAIYHDKPGVMYENPPPPSDYSEDDGDSVVFTYPRPQRVKGAAFIKIDYNLLHEFFTGKQKEEKETSAETLREDENIEGKTEESNAEFSVNNIEDFVQEIRKSKASKEDLVNNAVLEKTKIKQEIFLDEESAVLPEKKKEKRRKKKAPVSKSPVSISKSYSVSESDSDSNEKRKSKSSSYHKKSHSKKSSRRRRSSEFSVKKEIFSESDEENLSSTCTKKAEISVKEEVLSDSDDSRKEKIKSSKCSKKKYIDARSRDDSRKYYESRSRDDSRSRFDSRSRDDSRSRFDSRSRDDSRSRFDDSRSPDTSRSPDDYRSRDGSRKYPDDYYSDDSRNRHYDDSNTSSKNSRSYMKREIKQEIKQEPDCASYYGTSDYYCDVCKINLNSETTYNSHIIGKKHKKMVRQISEQEVAKSSILEITGSQKPSRSSDAGEIELHEVSKIQETCEQSGLLIAGLKFVREIRRSEDTKYFCELCSAQCVANSIVKHLIGFKHQKNCMKAYGYRNYHYIKDLEKRDSRYDRELTRNLEDIIRRHGMGKIKVFQDIKINQRSSEPFNPYQPSTSRSILLPEDVQGKKVEDQKVTDEECLSRDYSDFYCKVCNVHMNNYSMWESHARGKKHLKNKKKTEEGIRATSNYIEAPPGTISHLEELIQKHCTPDAIIVGLKFIQENQGENGDLYNCFLCGSVCPTIDIIDHLFLVKHKTRYLEKMLSDGFHNAINEINSFPIGETARLGLIDDECYKFIQEFGPGKPVICIAKKTF